MHRTTRTAQNWVARAVNRAVEAGEFPMGRRISTHTFRHSYARHMLAYGIPINVLSRWLGHANLSTTMVYLDLLPDPTHTLTTIL